MKRILYAGTAAVALVAGMAHADGHLIFAPGEGPFSWDAYNDYAASAPDLSGQSGTIFGPWLNPEDEIFSSMLAYFEEATGAEVTYTGSDGFEQQIVIDAEAGSPPNIAVFPQPGLAANLAEQGLLAPLGDDAAAWVSENYALYPHMTVRDNMSFALKLAKKSAVEIDAAVTKAAKILQLEEYLDRLPKALSGGQRQRVAIGRSIVRDPKVYLFDEPLSNLDAALRVATRIEIAQLKESMPESTMIYVTHDQVEAMTLASRIVVLDVLKDNGYSHSIAQVGTPLELYETPENEFVAQFIGSPAMNLLPGKIVETGDKTGVSIDDGSGVIYSDIKTTEAGKGLTVNVGIRPEDFMPAKTSDHAFSGTVEIAEALGEVTLLYFETPKSDADIKPVIAKMPGIHKSMRGNTVQLTADPAKVHLFHNGHSLYYR